MVLTLPWSFMRKKGRHNTIWNELDTETADNTTGVQEMNCCLFIAPPAQYKGLWLQVVHFATYKETTISEVEEVSTGLQQADEKIWLTTW